MLDPAPVVNIWIKIAAHIVVGAQGKGNICRRMLRC
jgi:hypothetical protein